MEVDIGSPMQQYLSKLGDARITEERLHELRSGKPRYLDIQRDREKLDHLKYQPNVDSLRLLKKSIMKTSANSDCTDGFD